MVFFLSFGIRRQEEELDGRPRAPPARADEAGQLALRELAQLGIGQGLLVVADLLLEVPVAPERLDERLEIAPLLVQLLRAASRSARTSGLQRSSSSSP